MVLFCSWHFCLVYLTKQLVTQQLNDGVRMLQLQVHNQGGALRLCHSICVSLPCQSPQDAPDQFNSIQGHSRLRSVTRLP